jgi:hypothetical protein
LTKNPAKEDVRNRAFLKPANDDVSGAVKPARVIVGGRLAGGRFGDRKASVRASRPMRVDGDLPRRDLTARFQNLAEIFTQIGLRTWAEISDKTLTLR